MRGRRKTIIVDQNSYRAGWLAGETGKGWHHNPHPFGSLAYAAWEIGNNDQAEGAKPLVRINLKEIA